MESTSVLETLHQFLPGLPPGMLEAWGQFALFAVPVCLYFAAVVLPFVVLYGLIRAHFGRRSLLERCSRQQARLGNVLNWLFLFFTVGVWASGSAFLENLHPAYRLALYVCAGLLLGGTLLWTVVVTAWKPLRARPVLHGVLAFVVGTCLAWIPVIGLLLARLCVQGTELPPESDLRTLAALLLPPPNDAFWLYFGLLHFLEVAAAGSFGLCWLLVRRRIDDFGRDYYVFAANWCGEWAAWGGWLTLLLTGGLCAMLRWQGLLPFEREGVPAFVGVLFVTVLVPAVLWTVIARSAAPMRHKIGMVVSLLFLIAAVTNLGALVSLLPAV